jgi:hypothetical protein
MDAQELAKEIQSCLTGGCTATVDAKGHVYAGHDDTDMIANIPVVYSVQAGRYPMTEANMLALANEALAAIAEWEDNKTPYGEVR